MEKNNKLINLLSYHIKAEGMITLHASSDAEKFIVETAVEPAKFQDT